MTKPEKWDELPFNLQERLIYFCDLDYDPYEGSNAEATEQLLYGTYGENDRNWAIVQSYFKGMSEDRLLEMLKSEIEATEGQLDRLKAFLVSF